MSGPADGIPRQPASGGGSPDSGRWLAPAVVAAVASILVFRSFNAVMYPILHCEDGTEMLAYYLNRPHPLGVFRDYAGYVSLMPNLMGYAAARLLPPHVAPYAMVGFSLAMATAALSLFVSRSFRFVVPKDRSRALICLIVASVPLGNHALITNLTYSLWHIFLIALLSILAPMPATSRGRLAQAGYLCLAICSHPLSIVFVPICLVLSIARRSRGERLRNLGILVVVLLYAWLGIRSTETAGSGEELAAVGISAEYVAHRVVFESVFGNRMRMILQGSHQTWIILRLALCAVAILMSLVLLEARSPGVRHRLALLAVLA
ncbi:MAG: hypothetical protein MI919_11155, partial [Holophagales bacterium]|nr:hypothetical protein [Holophagales bacterium]